MQRTDEIHRVSLVYETCVIAYLTDETSILHSSTCHVVTPKDDDPELVFDRPEGMPKATGWSLLGLNYFRYLRKRIPDSAPQRFLWVCRPSIGETEFQAIFEQFLSPFWHFYKDSQWRLCATTVRERVCNEVEGCPLEIHVTTDSEHTKLRAWFDENRQEIILPENREGDIDRVFGSLDDMDGIEIIPRKGIINRKRLEQSPPFMVWIGHPEEDGRENMDLSREISSHYSSNWVFCQKIDFPDPSLVSPSTGTANVFPGPVPHNVPQSTSLALVDHSIGNVATGHHARYGQQPLPTFFLPEEAMHMENVGAFKMLNDAS